MLTLIVCYKPSQYLEHKINLRSHSELTTAYKNELHLMFLFIAGQINVNAGLLNYN